MNLKEKYPNYNRQSMELQRITIAPVGVPSNHNNVSITIGKNAITDFLNKIIGTPLYYVEGKPIKEQTTHGSGDKNKKVIGTSIGAGIITDEKGTEWIYSDYALFSDVNQTEIQEILDNKDIVSSSMEVKPLFDNYTNIEGLEDYLGTSILCKGNSAWDNEILYAEKGEDTKSNEVTVKYDDAFLQIIGKSADSIKAEYEDKITQIQEMINKKDQELVELNQKYDALVEVNSKLTEYLK